MSENKKEEEKKKKRKYLVFFISFLIIGTLVAQGTYAWFVNSRKRANRFETGEIKHEIVENFSTTGKAKDLLPNVVVNKDVFIHNTSKSDALLRVKAYPVWVDAQSKTTDASNEIELIFPSDLTTNWTKGADGFYYYNFILEKHLNNTNHLAEGSLTSNMYNKSKCYSKMFLDAVKLKKTVTDQTKFANKTLDVVIESDVLQVDLDGAKEEWKIDNDTTIATLVTKLVNEYKQRN